MLRCGGYDVLVYLRFMSLSLKIFGSFAPYAFAVLLPINASCGYKDDYPNTFDRLTLSAVPSNDPRMWAHCLGCFLLTALTMHWLAREARWSSRRADLPLTNRGDAAAATRIFL